MSGTALNAFALTPVPGSQVGYLGGAASGISATQDGGASWRPRNDITRQTDMHVASILAHPTLATRAWQLVGTSDGTGGALYETLDGGASWHSASGAQTEVYGVGTSVKGLLTPAATPRSVGHLLACDPTSRGGAAFGYVYVGTFDEGVWRGTLGDPAGGGGVSGWTQIGLAPTRDALTNAKTAAYYIRSVAYDVATDTLYVSTYVNASATGPTPLSGRVWRCPSPDGATPSFTELTASPRCVEDMAVVRDTLFAAAHNPAVAAERGGFFLQGAATSGAAAAWTKIAEVPVASQSGLATDPDVWRAVDGLDLGPTVSLLFGCDQPAPNAAGGPTAPAIWRLSATQGSGGSGPTPIVPAPAPQYDDPIWLTGITAANDTTWSQDKELGRVDSIVIVGQTAFVGGNYTQVRTRAGDPRGSSALITQSYLSAWDLSTGNLLTWNPQANDRVYALAVSPDGSRIYVGGQFTTVGGSAHSKFVTVTATNLSATGSAAVMSSPGHTFNNAIKAIAVAGTTGIGSAVYVGGSFTTVNGSATWMRLAKMNPTGWALDANWTPQAKVAANAGTQDVRAITLLASRSAVLIAGWFDTVAPDPASAFDANQKFIACLSQADGSILPWASHGGYTQGTHVYPPAEILDMAGPDRFGQVYAAVGGSGGRITAFRVSDGSQQWSLWTDGNCQAVALCGDLIVCGMHGDNISAQLNLKSSDATGTAPIRHKGFMVDHLGALQPWDPSFGSSSNTASADYGGVLGIFAAAGLADGTAIVGGDFTTVGGASRHRLAYFPGGGTAAGWSFTARTATGDTLPGYPGNFADVRNEVGGPGGPHSWVYDSLQNEVLGKPGFSCSLVYIDRNDPTNYYAAGDHELYFSPDQGDTWYPYNRGHGAITVARTMVNPQTAGQVLVGTSTYGLFLVTQSGAAVQRITPAGAAPNCWGLSPDDPGSGPVGAVAAFSTDFGVVNPSSDVWANTDPFAGAGWTNLTGGTGYATFGGLISGLLSVRRGDGVRVITVAVRGVGIFQAVGAAGFARVADTQFTPAGTVMRNQVLNTASFTWRSGSSNIYLLDRQSGVWRGANYGAGPWVRIFNMSVTQEYQGSIRAHPTDDTILFVSDGTHLYRITNASTAGSSAATTVDITGAIPHPGPIALDASRVRVASIVAPGTPAAFYEATLADATTGAPPSWTSQDDVFYRQAALWPRQLSFDSGLTDYVGTDGMGLVVGASGAPPPPPPTGSGVYLAAGDAGTFALAATTAIVADQHDNLKADGMFVLGDLAYECGSTADYAADWATHWGLYDKRSGAQWMWPTTGAHDWGPNGSAGLSCSNPSLEGYESHFTGAGMLINDPGVTRSATVGSEAGYYYYRDIPGTNWRHISLVGVKKIGATRLVVDGAVGSDQYNWLQATLQDAQSRQLNVIATWGAPRFTTTSTQDGTTVKHKDEPLVQPFWDLLYQYAAGRCVVLSGHQHNYERFSPLNPSGAPASDGILQFIVGTGGQGLYQALGARHAGSAYYNTSDNGVLRLTLRPDGIDWAFISTAAAPTNTDAGSYTLPGSTSTQSSVTPADVGRLAVEAATVAVGALGQQNLAVADRGVLTLEGISVNQGGRGVPFTGSIYTGVGTFFAKDDRQAALSHFVEGVRQTDGQSPLAALAVTPHSPADLSVDVGVGWAIVKGDDVQNQSNYMDFNNAASRVQLPGSAPPPSSPGTSRIDAIVAKLNDSEAKVVPSGEPADQMFFQWVPGTAQAGVTLASPGTSPPAIPPTSLLLAWVQVDNAASQIQAGQILDKRKLYAPAIPGADGHVYRFTVSSQGTPALEVVS